MSTIPVLSGEISLFYDESDGLRVECSQKHARRLQEFLAKAHLSCGDVNIAIPSTGTISDWVVFEVSNTTFSDMKEAILTGLKTDGVTVKEESFPGPGENHVRLNLTNISVFDR